MGRAEEFHEKWAAVCTNTRAQVLRVHALDDVDAASIAARAAPPERTVFTDGSKQQGGNRQQRALAASGPAGWAAVTVHACPISRRQWVSHAIAGRVVTRPGSPGYQGATQGTNNTAELTALLEAVREEMGRPAGVVAFRVDSTYAINVATGKWAPRSRNGELARRLRRAAFDLISRRGAPSVRFEHVRAHTGEPGNESADALAKAAVQDAEMCGATLDVLQCAQDAYIRALRAKAGRADARPVGQQGSQSSSDRGSHVQPGVRREGFSLGVG